MKSLNKLRMQPDTYHKKAQYHFGEVLGAGAYGTVREAEYKGNKCAVKIILKKRLKGKEAMIHDEVNVLRAFDHPHIVKIVDFFESKSKFYLVTQLASGGSLSRRISDGGRFTEKDASRTIRQVLIAVDYLHGQNVVHRDLKPENLVYLTEEANSPLLLVDFGIAKTLDGPDAVSTLTSGSLGYAAPEVMLQQPHDKAADLWSLGIITYLLLCGYCPFKSQMLCDLIEECKGGPVIFHDRYWKDVTKAARDFIVMLLQPDPQRRPTSQKALGHMWLTGETASEHDVIADRFDGTSQG
ncbi:Calmodulin-dependent protein kinase cmk2 [Exophiala xenobiotica]|nr:Calmodulin-dependent protein kinase cmk2 [Exophiala xenobiotica]KAK5258913.1 Calmodulin-dependent protein kinase cmk2 [Exophiala xenobiotica]KAK5355179.1 Calmodulin-dependent protein kinase cmk2 [Exophiala xenobiotica]KAK5432335.1 Calmodulin-dependent protein kinase cmk2 [Exophiala xenobiotica]KAK5550385.1 Calmodulin-dependent protein kinase cmk2 [Exophiala xenobiotica]